MGSRRGRKRYKGVLWLLRSRGDIVQVITDASEGPCKILEDEMKRSFEMAFLRISSLPWDRGVWFTCGDSLKAMMRRHCNFMKACVSLIRAVQH